MKKIYKYDQKLKEKLDNLCFTIFCEIKHLELYVELLGEFEVKGKPDSELIKIIKNSFGFQIASIFSRITEKQNRESANIFYIQNTIKFNINKISETESEKNELLKLSTDISDFAKKYKADIQVFGDIKDVKISHNDLKLAKSKQEKRLQFSLTRMREIKNDLIKIFKKFEGKTNFETKVLDKIKNEVDLFCSNFSLIKI